MTFLLHPCEGTHDCGRRLGDIEDISSECIYKGSDGYCIQNLKFFSTECVVISVGCVPVQIFNDHYRFYLHFPTLSLAEISVKLKKYP